MENFCEGIFTLENEDFIWRIFKGQKRDLEGGDRKGVKGICLHLLIYLWKDYLVWYRI